MKRLRAPPFHRLTNLKKKWQCLYMKVIPTMLFGQGRVESVVINLF